MNNNSLGMKIVMAAVAVALTAYFGFQAYNYFTDPLYTTLAYNYVVEEEATLSGYVVREEQVLPGEASGLLRLNFLSADTQLEEGDIITTSGAGGDYPKYLGIGTVKSVEKSESDVSKYAVIQPMENLTDVTEVFVIVSFPGKGDTSVPGVEIPTGPEDGEDTE